MLPQSIQNLINEFSKLPGIGPKTAARLTFYLLSKADQDIKKLGSTVSDLKNGLIFCQKCYNIATISPCKICSDTKRNDKIICVVEETLDTVALEKTEFSGIYHVLGGVISPIDGIGPQDIRISQLLNRLVTEDVDELILATNPTLEGEATAMYITSQIEKLPNSKLNNKKIKITRLARGLPVGGDLEYTDEVTLKRALEGRREY